MAFIWENPSEDISTSQNILASTFTEIQDNVDHVDDNLECDTHHSTYDNDQNTGVQGDHDSGYDNNENTGIDNNRNTGYNSGERFSHYSSASTGCATHYSTYYGSY